MVHVNELRRMTTWGLYIQLSVKSWIWVESKPHLPGYVCSLKPSIEGWLPEKCKAIFMVCPLQFCVNIHRLKGELEQLNIWINTQAITNIFSFAQVEKLCPITYDTFNIWDKFLVITSKGYACFRKNWVDLPFTNLKDKKATYCLNNALWTNVQISSKRQLKEVVEALGAILTLGSPLRQSSLKWYVKISYQLQSIPLCNIQS